MSIVPKKKRTAAEALRRAIRGIEDARAPDRPHLPLGVPEIDRALPGGGLRLGCIHEVVGDEAATGFCAALLARAGGGRGGGGGNGGGGGRGGGGGGRRGGGGGGGGRGGHGGGRGGGRGGGGSGDAHAGRAARRRRGALLWLARGDDLYAPGLVRFGIEAGQLVVVSGLQRRDDMLWAMEEALRCRALAGVVAETGEIGLTAGRRLMLAAEGTGVLGLALSRGDGGRAGARRGGGAGGAGVVSRWRVTAVPCGGGGGGPRWRVEVLHCRGGKPLDRVVRWR